MTDCYVLVWNSDTGRNPSTIMAADDPEALNSKMAEFTAYEQSRMHIENVERWEDGDQI